MLIPRTANESNPFDRLSLQRPALGVGRPAAPDATTAGYVLEHQCAREAQCERCLGDVTGGM